MKNKKLIILMCNLPWNWSTDYTNQTAHKLSQKHFVCCYMLGEMKSFKQYIALKKIPKIWIKKSSDLYQFYPIHFIPFQRLTWVRRLNQWLNTQLLLLIIAVICLRQKFSQKILWVFDPRFYSLYKHFNKYFLLYDCVDYIQEPNNFVLENANLVVAISKTLKKIYQRKRPDIHIVPQGFRLDIFQKAFTTTSIKLPRGKPLIGYVGGINFRLDYKLLNQLVSQCPEYNFIFVGPILSDVPNFYQKYYPKIKKLFGYKNAFHINQQPKRHIPWLIKQFDICIIPYNSTDFFNRYSYPMKIFEYFYLGKPVISTQIDELESFAPYVYLSNSSKSWKKWIKSKLRQPWPPKYKKIQRQLAIKNSWEMKIDSILELI